MWISSSWWGKRPDSNFDHTGISENEEYVRSKTKNNNA